MILLFGISQKSRFIALGVYCEIVFGGAGKNSLARGSRAVRRKWSILKEREGRRGRWNSKMEKEAREKRKRRGGEEVPT